MKIENILKRERKQDVLKFLSVAVPLRGERLKLLEPYDGKLSRTVLKGERGCEAPDLPDFCVFYLQIRIVA